MKRIRIPNFKAISKDMQVRQNLEDLLISDPDSFAVTASIFTPDGLSYSQRKAREWSKKSKYTIPSTFAVKLSIAGITLRSQFSAITNLSTGRYYKGTIAERRYDKLRLHIQPKSFRLTLHTYLPGIDTPRKCVMGSRCYEYGGKCNMVWVEPDLDNDEFANALWTEPGGVLLPMGRIISKLAVITQITKSTGKLPITAGPMKGAVVLS